MKNNSNFKLPPRERIQDRQDMVEEVNEKNRIAGGTVEFAKPQANRIFQVHKAIIPMDYANIRDEGGDEQMCLLNFEEDHEEKIKVFSRRKALGLCYITLCVDTQEIPFVWLVKQAGHGKREMNYHVSVRRLMQAGQEGWVVGFWDDKTKTYITEKDEFAKSKQPVWPMTKLQKSVEEILTETIEETGNFITDFEDPRVRAFREGL